jgi:DNA-binding SARP family transcriptional activator
MVQGKVWRVELHGVPAATSPAGERQALGLRLACLLALAAALPGLDRARAAALLYPQLEAAAARRNLRQLLFAHRLLLAQLLAPHDSLLRLRPGLLQPAEPLLGELSFPDLPEFQAWLDQQRRQVAQSQLAELEAAAESREQAGEIDAALALAQRLIEAAPASEHAWRRLMRLHHQRGDRAAALAAFDRCEQMLRDEFGARPSAPTLALLEQVQNSRLPATTAARAVPASVLRPPRLVGRADDWARALAAWQAGQPVLVLGEAGLGKSRFCGDLAAACGGAVQVAARPGDARLPYALLARALRAWLGWPGVEAGAALRAEFARLLPELGPARPFRHDSDRLRFAGAVEALLQQAQQQGLQGTVLDDLQFADAASLQLLEQLAGAAPLRWVLALRPAELGDEGRALLAALAPRRPEQLTLQPLDGAEVAELLATLAVPELGPGLAPALHQRSGGNPLFLLETLKLLCMQPTAVSSAVLPLAGGVVQLIRQRLERLSAPALRLARCAAIAGQDFSAPLAARVLGREMLDLADAWAELEAAQVLRDGVFAHDLIQEAAAASVPPALARALHAQLAELLAEGGGAPGRIAAHWVAAQRPDRAVPALRAEAEQARAALRHTEAVRALDQALALLPPAARAERFALLLALDASLYQLADNARRHANNRQLGEAARTPQERFEYLLALTELQVTDLLEEPAVESARAALALAQTLNAPQQVVRARMALADALARADRRDEAEAQLRGCRAAVDASGDAAQRLRWYHAAAVLAEGRERFDELLAHMGHAHEAALAAGDLDAVDSVLSWTVNGLVGAGDYHGAATAVDRHLAWTQQHGTAKAQFGELNAALVFTQIGHFDRALAMLQRADTLQLPAQAMLNARWAQLYWLLGQGWRALPRIAAAEAHPTLSPGMRLSLLQLRYRLRVGGAHEPAPELAGLLAEAQATARRMNRSSMLLRVSLMRTELMPGPDVLTEMKQGLQRATEQGLHGYRIATAAWLARLQQQAGRPQEARRHAELALALCETHWPDNLSYPMLGLMLADALEPADPLRAQQVLHDTSTWLHRIAAEHVPAEFRESFLQRNPVHREVGLRAAQAAQHLLR